MTSDLRLLMIAAMYENGGNTTQRLFDGHPEMLVYPFESQLGTRLVNDRLASLFPVKYRWPVFALDASADEDYGAIIDEECKVRARTPKVSKFRDVAFDDLVGLWLPVQLTGPAVPWAGTEWGAVWFGDGVVSTTHDCTSWSGSIDNFSGVGGFNTVLEPSFQRCLAGAAEMDVGPDSSIVLRRARWVQLTGDLLTFYGMRDRVLGTYQRDWMPVRAGQLIGSWRPLRLFGEEPQRVNGRMPLLRFLTETSLLGLPLQRVVADDGVNDTSGLFRLGSGAAWSTSDLGTTLVGCLGDCPKVRNADVIQSAVRVQLVNGLLAFYDADGHMIGLYRRT